MENDEITDESEVETQHGQELEAEELEIAPTEEDSNDTEDLAEKLAKAEAESNKWRRLAQKNQKKPEAVKPKETSKSSPDSIDERILKAQGMADELIEELKTISHIRGVGLIEAQTDHLFVATKEKFERDQKAKQASMSSSRGSGQPAPKKGLNTPDLSREEHMALAKEMMSKL